MPPSRQSQRRGAAVRPGPDPQELPADIDELDPADALADLDFTATLVTLYRQDPTAPTRYAYLDSFPAEGFTIEAVKQTHGGGSYRLHIRDGSRKVRKQFAFAIAGPPRIPTLAGPTEAPPVRASAGSESSELREVVKALQDTVKALAGAQTRPQSDPMELAVKIAAGFQAAQAQAFQQLQAMQEAAGPRSRGPGLTVADMRELIELGKEQAAGAAPADPVVDLAARLGPPLLGLIDRGLRQDAAARAAAPMPPGVVGHIPQVAPAAPEGGDVPQDLAGRIRPHLGTLLWMARADVDPEPLAATIAQSLPDPDLGALAQILAAPDALAQVLQALPELAAYEGWTSRLLGELTRELTGEDDATATDTPAEAAG